MSYNPSSGGVSDGDKGSVTVIGGGSTWSINDGVVSNEKIANVDSSKLTGNVADARLSANVTVQGNTFNGTSQLVKTTALGKLPALDGSLLTSVPAVATWGGVLGTLSAQTDLQDALDGKSGTGHNHIGTYEPANANIQAHVSSTSNPHSVTKSQVGLANADNTSDANKPVSTATQTALDAKQATLVSATNIKTINGSTILGSGDLVVSGGGINTMKKTATQIINGTAFQDIADLTFPVVSGTNYAFYFYVVFRSTAATGFRFGVNCPTGTLDYFHTYQTVANSATVGVATWLNRHDVTRDAMTVTTATITAGVDLISIIEGRYLCTQNGTFAARAASESANNDLVIQIGSYGTWF